MTDRVRLITCLLGCVFIVAWAGAQEIDIEHVDSWVTVTGSAAGVDDKAKDEAVAQALRKAVEESCGVFLTSQSKAEDYQITYDKIFADAVGYVRQHKVIKVWTEDGKTLAKVRARVSTQKFEQDWAAIAHTVEQEDNPRVIIAIVEEIRQTTTGAPTIVEDAGVVQSMMEDFFLSKGITLMDRETTSNVTKRDVLLAAIKNDEKELAALGARFKADVVVIGRATAKYGKTIEIEGVEMHQFTSKLTVRVIQSDSGLVLASKSYGPVTANSLQRGGGEDRVLAKLADDSAPELLGAVIEAWRQRANVHRKISLSISGMTFKKWKAFEKEVKTLRGVQAVRRREITENVAHVDIEYRYGIDGLAEHLGELESMELEVTEITTNRIKLKLIED